MNKKAQKKPQNKPKKNTQGKKVPKKSAMKSFIGHLSKILKKNGVKKVNKSQVGQKDKKLRKVKKSQVKVLVKKQKRLLKKSVQKVSKKLPKTVKKLVNKSSNTAKKRIQKNIKTKPSQNKFSTDKKKQKVVSVDKKTIVEVPEVMPEAEAQTFVHEPVLLREIVQYLDPAHKKIVVDGTLGLGGHSEKMLAVMPPDAKLVGFDVDMDNMATARERLKGFGDRASFVASNFSHLKDELERLNIHSVDAILLDLGLSSPQVDNAEKGFSFLREGPLDMRFDKTQQLTAADIVNGYGLHEMIRIFKEYGEESYARKIATEIIRQRKIRSFKTTTELADFIEKLIGRKGHIHPATRIFQALRIEVNHELDVLSEALKQAVAVLSKGGRLGVIAYHSLEDRVVKQFFKECARDFVNEPDKLTTTHLDPTLKIITKKPVVPSDLEIAKNPRSRSAKLRVAEKM